MVQLMNKIKIKNKKTTVIHEYLRVSESEANLKEGKIAVNSRIAKALIDKKHVDIVKFLCTFECPINRGLN